MSSRWSALLVWALAAAAAVFWGLRLLVPSPPVPAQARLADSRPMVAGDLTRLLGTPPVKAPEQAPVAPDAASRFKLTGVVATRSVRDASAPVAAGLALIAVDGKPAQAYRVGDALDPQWVLQSVALRSARIAPNAGNGGFLLELPPPVAPATGIPGGAMPMVAPPAGYPQGAPVPPQTPFNQAMPPSLAPPGMQQPGMPAQNMPQPAGADTQNRGQIQ